MKPVVLLAGGSGGAKLARGLLDELGPDLVVIANTGDDVELLGAYVAPDPDLVTFWLADAIDERGWAWPTTPSTAWTSCGPWARCLVQPRRSRPGDRPAPRAAARGGGAADATIDELRRAFDIPARVLVPTDDRLRTCIRARGRWHPFQEFMIRITEPGRGRGVPLRARPRPTPEALEAIAEARAIIIGPSNPVLSIDPILCVLSDALRAAAAPVVAVRRSWAGRSSRARPPIASLAGRSLDSDGIADHYEGLIAGLVADQRAGRHDAGESSTSATHEVRRRVRARSSIRRRANVRS